jgi:tetratricopeptide (TPR) repeat protein
MELLAAERYNAGRFDEALALYDQLLDEQRTSGMSRTSPKHVNIMCKKIMVLNQMANENNDCGAQAESLCRELLQWMQEDTHYNKNNNSSSSDSNNNNSTQRPIYANVLNILGSLLLRRGSFDEAEKSFREALSIFERTVGRQTKFYVMAKINLANLYYHREQLKQSLQLYQEALDEWQRATPDPTSDEYASTIGRVGHLLWRTGQFDAALVQLERSLELLRRSSTANELERLSVLVDIAVLYALQHRLEQALQLMEEVSSIERNAYGKETELTLEFSASLRRLQHQVQNPNVTKDNNDDDNK